jgi:pathogenesis-related protein 1
MRYAKLVINAIAANFSIVSGYAALPANSVSMTISGSTATVNITPLKSDAGKSVGFYLAASTQDGKVYFHNGFKWILTDIANITKFPPSIYISKTLDNSGSTYIFTADTSPGPGTVILIGYGIDLNDLISRSNFSSPGIIPKPITPQAITEFTATATQSNNIFSVSITPNATDLGKSGAIFVAALVDKAVYFNNGKQWSLFNGKDGPEFIMGTLASDTRFSVDISGITPSSISPSSLVVGYGTSFSDLVSGNKFKSFTVTPVTVDISKPFVDQHNIWRAQVGVPNLKWSSALADFAQAWADNLKKSNSCGLTHRDGTNRLLNGQTTGENIFGGTGLSTGFRYSAKDVADAWASEIKDYTASTGVCKSGAVCGHYTQIVWKTTTEVGCGRASCGGSGNEVWVCNYLPAGNFIGQKPF